MAKSKHKRKSFGIIEPEKHLDVSKDSLDGIDYPVFCFKHLQTTSIKDCRESDFFFRFLERLQKLSNLGWNEIRKSPRHGFGIEPLPVDSIKPQLPAFITPDVKHLTVFRAHGDNRPFLGHQNGKVFHIVFIESRFGDIYDH